MIIREQYTDIAAGDWEAVERGGYDSCQVKFDGEFTNIVIKGRQADVLSREGALIETLELGIRLPAMTLLAERMTAKRPEGLRAAAVKPGHLIVFGAHKGGRYVPQAEWPDCVWSPERAWTSAWMQHRSEGFERYWLRYVVGFRHEGLIFRNSAMPGYCARMVNPDYRPFG